MKLLVKLRGGKCKLSSQATVEWQVAAVKQKCGPSFNPVVLVFDREVITETFGSLDM